jgi:hypothetical protein
MTLRLTNPMPHLRPLLAALALVALLAARIAPDYAEALMLSAADSISGTELPCPLRLLPCPASTKP